MNDYFSEFIQNLKFYRSQKKLSQAKLAELCDCSYGMIGAIESGRSKPSFDMILAISSALNVHPADLFLRNTSTNSIMMRHRLQNLLVPGIISLIRQNFPE